MRDDYEYLLLCSIVPHSSGSKLGLNSYAGTGKQSSAQLLPYSPRILAAQSSLAEHSATESITNIWVNAIHPAGISMMVIKSRWKFWAEMKGKMCFPEKSSSNQFPGRRNLVDFKTRSESTASFHEQGKIRVNEAWLSQPTGCPLESQGEQSPGSNKSTRFLPHLLCSTKEQSFWMSGQLTTPKRASMENNDEVTLTGGERRRTEKEESGWGGRDRVWQC